jgi:uncharacterized protein YybS (DUF2232 family)
MAAALIPFVGVIFLVMLPQVMFVLCLQNDQRKTVTAFLIPLIAFFMILALMKAIMPALALGAMGLAGWAMARSVREQYTLETLVLLPSLILLGVLTFYFIFGGIQLSISPWQLIQKHIQEAVELNISLYSRLPLSPDEIKSIQDGKDSVIRLFSKIFPALCAIAVLFTVWINLLTAKRILMKTGIVPPQLANLSEWKTPFWLIWIFLAAGALILIPHTLISFAGINLFLSISFVYLLQGFAIVSFFFEQKNISPFFRSLFYFFIAIQQILMIAITIVGFFDIWIDFRKYFRNDQTIE